MYIPLTFPKCPLINGVIVHVWYVFSGKMSNGAIRRKLAIDNQDIIGQHRGKRTEVNPDPNQIGLLEEL